MSASTGMPAPAIPAPAVVAARRQTLWSKAAWKFRRDRAGMIGLAIVLAYFVAALGEPPGELGRMGPPEGAVLLAHRAE